MSAKKKLEKQLLSIKPAAGHCTDCGRDRTGTTVNRIIDGLERTVFVCHTCYRHGNQNRPPRRTKVARIQAQRAAANP